MSSFMMLSFGLTPIGVFPMAMAADRVGAANAIFGASMILVLVVIAFITWSATLRNLDNSVRAAISRNNDAAESKLVSATQ